MKHTTHTYTQTHTYTHTHWAAASHPNLGPAALWGQLGGGVSVSVVGGRHPNLGPAALWGQLGVGN